MKNANSKPAVVNIKHKTYGLKTDNIKDVVQLYAKPVEHVVGGVVYRVVAMFRDVCVSEAGVVLSVDSLTPHSVITVRKASKPYMALSTFDYVNGFNRSIYLHRLVAMAWCDNDDWWRKNIVDHKDGNPLNNAASNLRWTTPSSNCANTAHGMLGKYTVTNVSTGYSVVRDSLAKVAKHLDIPHQRLSAIELPGDVVVRGKTYHIAINDPDEHKGPSAVLTKKSKFSVYKLDNKDEKLYFKTKNELVRHFKLAIYPRTIANARLKLKEMGYGVRDIYGVTKTNKYDILNLVTGVEHKGVLLKEAIELIGCSKSGVLTRINRDYSYGKPINGWILKTEKAAEYGVCCDA